MKPHREEGHGSHFSRESDGQGCTARAAAAFTRSSGRLTEVETANLFTISTSVVRESLLPRTLLLFHRPPQKFRLGMPPLYSIPQSISRRLVVALFGGVVGILGVASYARYTLGRPIRFKMLPDGSLELMSRAEILERRVMQTGRRLESDPESEVYQRMKNVSFTQ